MGYIMAGRRGGKSIYRERVLSVIVMIAIEGFYRHKQFVNKMYRVMLKSACH